MDELAAVVLDDTQQIGAHLTGDKGVAGVLKPLTALMASDRLTAAPQGAHAAWGRFRASRSRCAQSAWRS
jgi:hypothetical protein